MSRDLGILLKPKKKEQRARNGSYRVRARESGERRGNSIFLTNLKLKILKTK